LPQQVVAKRPSGFGCAIPARHCFAFSCTFPEVVAGLLNALAGYSRVLLLIDNYTVPYEACFPMVRGVQTSVSDEDMKELFDSYRGLSLATQFAEIRSRIDVKHISDPHLCSFDAAIAKIAGLALADQDAEEADADAKATKAAAKVAAAEKKAADKAADKAAKAEEKAAMEKLKSEAKEEAKAATEKAKVEAKAALEKAKAEATSIAKVAIAAATTVLAKAKATAKANATVAVSKARIACATAGKTAAETKAVIKQATADAKAVEIAAVEKAKADFTKVAEKVKADKAKRIEDAKASVVASASVSPPVSPPAAAVVVAPVPVAVAVVKPKAKAPKAVVVKKEAEDAINLCSDDDGDRDAPAPASEKKWTSKTPKVECTMEQRDKDNAELATPQTRSMYCGNCHVTLSMSENVNVRNGNFIGIECRNCVQQGKLSNFMCAHESRDDLGCNECDTKLKNALCNGNDITFNKKVAVSCDRAIAIRKAATRAASAAPAVVVAAAEPFDMEFESPAVVAAAAKEKPAATVTTLVPKRKTVVPLAAVAPPSPSKRQKTIASSAVATGQKKAKPTLVLSMVPNATAPIAVTAVHAVASASSASTSLTVLEQLTLAGEKFASETKALEDERDRAEQRLQEIYSEIAAKQAATAANRRKLLLARCDLAASASAVV
jgi:hypothetical protein